MSSSLERRDFLKAAGVGLGAATLGATLPWVDATLAAAEPITIKMWIWETVPHWKKVLAASGVPQRFPNVHVEFTALDFTSLHQKLITALTAGIATGLPDICRTYVGFYRQIVDAKRRPGRHPRDRALSQGYCAGPLRQPERPWPHLCRPR